MRTFRVRGWREDPVTRQEAHRQEREMSDREGECTTAIRYRPEV